MNHAQTRVATLSTVIRATAVVALFTAALLSWPVQAAPRDETSRGSSQTSNLVLVENGVSRAPIVVFEGAPPMTRRAADELAEYIEKISGAKPKVIVGEPDPLPERAIWVGFQPKLKELFPEVAFEFEHPEEILIAANDRHLVIAGRDRWDAERLNVPGRNSVIVGQQHEYGTANAVYTFLQRNLDVRWLWPGELGEDVVKQKTIAIAPHQYRYFPQMRQRHSLFRFSALGDGQLLRYVWQGVAEDRPALSDRQVTFANTLGRLLKKKYPGRDLFVGMHAYGHYRPAPIAAVPDDNVIISSVANMFYRDAAFRDEHRAQFRDWAEKSPTIFLRPNLPQWMSRLAIPHIARQETIDNFRFIAEHGCVGLFFDTNREHWSTQNVDFYLMAQMAWDPHQDGQSLLDDFYRRGFGPAADQVRAFHDTMEVAFARLVKTEGGRDLSKHLVKLRDEVYTDALFAQAEADLQRAAARAAGSPEKYGRRVAFLRAGLDFTQHLLLAVAAGQRYAQSKQQETAARDEARAHWKAIEQIDADYPLALYLRVISPQSSNIDLPLGEE